MLGLQFALSHPGEHKDVPSTPISKLLFVIEHVTQANKTTAILGFTSLGVLIFIRLIKQWAVKRPGGAWMRFVPEILLVVVGTTGKLPFFSICSAYASFDGSVQMGSERCASSGYRQYWFRRAFWITAR